MSTAQSCHKDKVHTDGEPQPPNPIFGSGKLDIYFVRLGLSEPTKSMFSMN
jgi:hypothetical protein